VLKNIAGGIIIILTAPFKAGDRIQVENDTGDVLDIRLFYSTLMEIREWVDGDQYSGRIVQIPNGFILNKPVKNYTKDFSFIWDEIHFMLTYDSDWKKAKEIVLRITHEITDNWIDMRLRYVVDPRKRRLVRHLLNEKILEAFDQEKDIKIASVTLEIVGFPPIKTDKG